MPPPDGELTPEDPDCTLCGHPADEHTAWVFTGSDESKGPICPDQLNDINCYTVTGEEE